MKWKIMHSDMNPIIHDGDTLFYTKQLFHRYKTNDIILITKGEEKYAHRIVYRTPDYLITKGDNNTFPDSRTYPRSIMGKVVQIQRNNKVFHIEDIYLIQSIAYMSEIKKIKREFEKNKIDYLFLKGLPIHLYYENKHPRRIYADCDILVGYKSLRKLDTLLHKSGFVREDNTVFNDFQKFIGKEVKETTYYKYIKGILIHLDIHYELTFFTHKVPNPFPELQKKATELTVEIMVNKQIVCISNEMFPIISDEFLIEYLFLHFFTHNHSGIHRLELISVIVNVLHRKGKMDWGKLFEHAYTKGLLNFIIPSVFLLSKYFKNTQSLKVLQNKYSRETNYTIGIYKYTHKKDSIFFTGVVMRERIKRAFMMFLLYDKNLMYKITCLLRPRILLHSINFLGKYVFGTK